MHYDYNMITCYACLLTQTLWKQDSSDHIGYEGWQLVNDHASLIRFDNILLYNCMCFILVRCTVTS